MMQLSIYIITIIGFSAVRVDSTHFEEANLSAKGCRVDTVIPCHSWIADFIRFHPISWLQRGGKRILQRPRGPHCSCFGFAVPQCHSAGQSRHDSVERWSLKTKDWYKKTSKNIKKRTHVVLVCISNINFKPSTIHWRKSSGAWRLTASRAGCWHLKFILFPELLVVPEEPFGHGHDSMLG